MHHPPLELLEGPDKLCILFQNEFDWMREEKSENGILRRCSAYF